MKIEKIFFPHQRKVFLLFKKYLCINTYILLKIFYRAFHSCCLIVLLMFNLRYVKHQEKTKWNVNWVHAVSFFRIIMSTKKMFPLTWTFLDEVTLIYCKTRKLGWIFFCVNFIFVWFYFMFSYASFARILVWKKI